MGNYNLKGRSMDMAGKFNSFCEANG